MTYHTKLKCNKALIDLIDNKMRTVTKLFKTFYNPTYNTLYGTLYGKYQATMPSNFGYS